MIYRPRLAFLALCAALALPARAGMFDDEEARRQIAELRKELHATTETLNRRLDEAAHNQLDFANQIEALRADVARLTGQVEVLANSLEAAHKRQQDFYVDLDNRLRKLESPAPAATEGAPVAAEVAAPAQETKADPQAEMHDYDAALGLLRAGKFKEAQTAFEGFIARHPKAALLPNATYWLGSSLYQQKQYAKSAETFARVAATWPADAKAPDALLAQGNALVEAKDEKGAVRAYQTLVEKYPTSPAVATARERIKTLAPKKSR
jgi:tol-pal system protein YbgF